MVRPLASFALALARRARSGGLIINEHTLDPDQTRQHVQVLGRWFEFIPLEELPRRLDQSDGRPFCLLTFDDGKRSNAIETAPELERLGVPAVFFLVASFVGGRTPLWFDRYRALRAKLGTPPFGLGRQIVKQLPHELLLERLERACTRYGVEADMEDDDVRPMTWDEARSLHRRGFRIGSHGFTHAVMTRERLPDAFDNIAKGIARVSAEIGSPCTSFAFPNGNYTAELAQHALRCGVTTVMTTEPTWVDRTFPLWRLPRVQLYGSDSREKIEFKLVLAATGRILTNPDSTGRVYTRINRLARRAVGR
jgi:peptidoglycan/xylan/chitin deacetylase (PgdA/CDA1 family)